MNTFGMKVKARCFIEYDSVADLVDIEFEELARPVLHIGGGSNLLFTDDFKGTVLHSKINFIEILDECQCITEAPSHSVGPSRPAAAGFSLQRSTGPFADRSRGWQNANSVYQAIRLLMKFETFRSKVSPLSEKGDLGER